MNTNLVVMSGVVIKDPEQRKTPKGATFTSFCLANRTNRKDNNGETISDLFNCVAWKIVGDNIYKYVKKGSKLTIFGRLENNPYIDKEGKKHNSTQIVINEVDFGVATKNKNDNLPY